MPPVFGPLSPLSLALWSCEVAIGKIFDDGTQRLMFLTRPRTIAKLSNRIKQMEGIVCLSFLLISLTTFDFYFLVEKINKQKVKVKGSKGY
jgi:hypothetical protein